MLLLLCYGRVLEDIFVINAGFLWKASFGHWNKDQAHKLIAVNKSFYLWDSHCAFLEFFHTLPFQSLCDAFELIVIYECSQNYWKRHFTMHFPKSLTKLVKLQSDYRQIHLATNIFNLSYRWHNTTNESLQNVKQGTF